MSRSKFSLPRYDPFTAKPGFFLVHVGGLSIKHRIPNGIWYFFREGADTARSSIHS